MKINPIIAMQQHRTKQQALKPAVLLRDAQLIIEAGYHCGWDMDEIQARLKHAGHIHSEEQIDSHYDHYHNSL